MKFDRRKFIKMMTAAVVAPTMVAPVPASRKKGSLRITEGITPEQGPYESDGIEPRDPEGWCSYYGQIYEYGHYVGFTHQPKVEEIATMTGLFQRQLTNLKLNHLNHPFEVSNLSVIYKEPKPELGEGVWTYGWKYTDKVA